MDSSLGLSFITQNEGYKENNFSGHLKQLYPLILIAVNDIFIQQIFMKIIIHLEY